MSIFFKNLFKKRTKRFTQNSPKRRKNSTKKVYSKSRKIGKKNTYHNLSSSIYSSFIIFAGFLSLSVTIFFLIRQLQPVIKNERLKFLCTYQLGNKKSQGYKDAKLELEKLLGDSEKYCNNFLLPKEKNKRGLRFFPLVRDIFFRFI
tara:strand:+ start:340 stop:780 length:441 start_codon:yes stop_codon:yes gene_type:complete